MNVLVGRPRPVTHRRLVESGKLDEPRNEALKLKAGRKPKVRDGKCQSVSTERCPVFPRFESFTTSLD